METEMAMAMEAMGAEEMATGTEEMTMEMAMEMAMETEKMAMAKMAMATGTMETMAMEEMATGIMVLRMVTAMGAPEPAVPLKSTV